ncbi:hypothetical protein CEXT_713021 [Caerostris extrusa]|uniref:Uncharacterized protein n=1 Tax=Caerostris extrusa TaxID=172846 RepID=A0AAV4TCX3_CAEEX|nr:hypothetical protein CEXT_713021 [Caerostris extrusa]
MLWSAEDGLTKRHWIRPDDALQDGAFTLAPGEREWRLRGKGLHWAVRDLPEQERKLSDWKVGGGVTGGLRDVVVSGAWLDNAALDATRRCISRWLMPKGILDRNPSGINRLEMHRLASSSAALSSYPPMTTASLNARLNCFHPYPLPSNRLISCPTPANPGQPNANLYLLNSILSPREQAWRRLPS